MKRKSKTGIIAGMIALVMGLVPGIASAQELNCTLNVVSTKITSGDKTVFEDLSKAMNQFVNNRRWTKMRFQSQERIPCSMTVDIQEYNSGTGQVKAYLSVQLRRPCFKSTYSSTVFNLIDKDFSFRYMKNDPLNYTDNSIGSNLTATLAFYVYIILGNYFDSFAPQGGAVFYTQAQNIVMQAQSFAEEGWRSSERNENNRYWIAESYTNGNYSAIHEVLYRYYRLGMDMMYDDPATARTNILQAMDQLNELNSRKTGGLAGVRLFMESRADELVNIYQPAAADERQKAMDLFIDLDPTRIDTYRKIMSGSGSAAAR